LMADGFCGGAIFIFIMPKHHKILQKIRA